MNIKPFRLLFLISEVAIGTYLAIHQDIGFWWTFFAIYGAGVSTSVFFNVLNKNLGWDI